MTSVYRKSQVVEPDHRLTRREMQDILNGYRMIFDMVHLLDGDALNLSRQQAEGEDMGDGCRADLGDPDQAMRCLALQALESRGEEAMVISDKGIGTFFFRDIEGNIFHLIQRPQPLI